VTEPRLIQAEGLNIGDLKDWRNKMSLCDRSNRLERVAAIAGTSPQRACISAGAPSLNVQAA
jgi:hypothetical protein